MTKYPIKIVSGVLQEEDTLLLCLRKDTEVFSGYWALPVGHCEDGENDVDTLRRELFEEVGIQVIDAELLMKLYDNELGIEHTVFRVLDWRGMIENLEPDLCEDIGWFHLDSLPEPLTPATQTVATSLINHAS